MGVANRQGWQPLAGNADSSGPSKAKKSITKAQRREAMEAAYRFAVVTMIQDFAATDLDEIANVADAYAKEHWREWVKQTWAFH